uniref:GLOBIN domain-containing protein n=3 Tax=Onchocerca TaxID=6281 RepID=A0A8R1TM55_ONCVO
MGNKESTNYHESGKIIRQPSNKRHSRTISPVRTRSESIPHPQSSRKLSSFRKEEETESQIASLNKNRSKSFRATSEQPRNLNNTRRRTMICEMTGLTAQQKAILATMWRQLPRGVIFDLGKRVFEIIFERDPKLLMIINLEHLQNTNQWQEHVNFRMHAQRFTHALSQSMRNLTEPIIAADRLQEFGASYVNQENITYGSLNVVIPHSYWDRLSAAITTTAQEFLNKQQLKTSKQTLTVDNVLLLENERRNSRNLFSQVSANINAWSILAQFIANQIRFGYEMELMLRVELKKLNVDRTMKQSLANRK